MHFIFQLYIYIKKLEWKEKTHHNTSSTILYFDARKLSPIEILPETRAGKFPPKKYS
jgi:hypothetical protein